MEQVIYSECFVWVSMVADMSILRPWLEVLDRAVGGFLGCRGVQLFEVLKGLEVLEEFTIFTRQEKVM